MVSDEDRRAIQMALVYKHHLQRMHQDKINALFNLADEWVSDAMATRTSDQFSGEYEDIVDKLIRFGRIF